MASHLTKDARKILAGKAGRLDDEELEYLAQKISKLGFKLGFARAYASGPDMMEKMLRVIEHQQNQLNQIQNIVGR